MLSITGGLFKGFRLITPRGIRPTSAKVRQALGNILANRFQGARVLDGFAGSGAAGIEALSRGAAFVAFVDSQTDAILAIRDNLQRLQTRLPSHAWRVVHLDLDRGLLHLAKVEKSFDLVFLDPPYQSPEGKKALISVVQCAILAPSGIVVVEHDRRTLTPSDVGPLTRYRQHRYGETVLSFYT